MGSHVRMYVCRRCIRTFSTASCVAMLQNTSVADRRTWRWSLHTRVNITDTPLRWRKVSAHAVNQAMDREWGSDE